MDIDPPSTPSIGKLMISCCCAVARVSEGYTAATEEYDVTSDGKRFLILESQQSTTTPITLVANWTGALRRK
jgi:hypothetical protein